jgi:hypothetical protein
MGFLQKMGLVEEVPTDKFVVSIEYDEVEDLADAELDVVNTDTLISDIYAQNNLADKSRSIFKVEELIESLPNEMTTETKRNSVLAILESFNLTATDMVAEGEERARVLSSIKAQIDAESEAAVTEKEAEIEELKKSIESLTIEIAEEKEKRRVSDETITIEVNKVETLVKFIGGVN